MGLSYQQGANVNTTTPIGTSPRRQYGQVLSAAELGAFELCENWGVEKYTVVIHEDHNAGFWAEVPALPGCYSQGETIDEVVVNVREAIAGVLEVMKEQGKQPEPNIQILDVAV